ncbi:hypothetical protein DCAR_0520798 [Daucus carota subsp. sativus]|uniref:ATP-dependent DNA helicase n=1 Tax=Daucus carota subsp. sativus TaxID=79200 RepID=A0AAF1AZS5_DAUCS|nr:hypothetical protein DCAR_0520798 [Daucus carota subsp. sativus]
MDSSGSGSSIPQPSHAAGRKRRGSGSALDDFLRERLSKIQQRGDTNSGLNPKAGHDTTRTPLFTVDKSSFIDIPSDQNVLRNTRTPLCSVDPNSLVTEPSHQHDPNKNFTGPLDHNAVPKKSAVEFASDSTHNSIAFQNQNDKENIPFSTPQQGSSGPIRKPRGPSVQTILDRKSDALSTSTKTPETKKRGRGPGVNKLFNSLQDKSGSSGGSHQETKKRVRGLGAKTLARQKLAQDAQDAIVQSASQNHYHQSSPDMLGSETPKSALTFQQFSSNGKNSTPEQHSSHTGPNRNGHTQKTSIPSSFLGEFGRDDCRRNFCPMSGASTSGVKDLRREFDNALDQSDFVEEVFQHDQDDITNDPDMWSGYCTLGPPNATCATCRAVMWDMERNNKSNRNAAPSFSLCCKSGQVILPLEDHPPEPLASLLNGGPKSPHFRQNIRVYNCMFAMCSSGGKVDHKINRGGAPFCFKIRGQNMHFIGSLIPEEGSKPKFCQLYIYDTDNENSNRIGAVGSNTDDVDMEIVEGLTRMLDENNKLVRYFRSARQRHKSGDQTEFKLILISSQAQNGRPNIIGPSNEVAGLIVNASADTAGCRDTVCQTKQGHLKRVFETDPFFMQLQFPLLFPLGEDGYHTRIPLRKTKKRSLQIEDAVDHEGERKIRDHVSMKEYYSSKLMIRLNEGLTPHLGGRLWQQYVIDAFTAMEQYRLDWISRNQTTIRSDLYTSVRDAVRRGDNDPSHVGKCVILPASFTGSKRYMSQYFKDLLALCRSIGHPSLFLTMTTNTKWPEIQEMMKNLPGVNVADAPDVVARVFKLKLDQLMELIKKKHFFGRLMHVIEFQKRGLPHAHMLIWLDDRDKPKTAEQIDKLVSAEIPDEHEDSIGYNAVKNYMIHGPCGKDATYSACMVNGRCGRHFPKRYSGVTCFDESGFPIYRRRNTGRTVLRKGHVLDNKFVVPYNRELLLRFQCHINLEICNNSRSLKYLFKYCLKGHDTATMLIKRKNDNSTKTASPASKSKVFDEVKHYLDGRYVCASEAAWRIFGFDIHSRWPSVDRLPIHLPESKYVSFKTGDSLQTVCNRADAKLSKLEAWFVANQKLPEARNYTYAEFPSYFTWLPRECKWKYRQRGEVVGRLSEVHPTAGDLLYLRMLLLRKKGCTKFEDLRTIDGLLYETYKEACGALGLLQNDKQWHDALSENAHSSFPHQIREMFVNILSYSSVADPHLLWKSHWKCMSEDILVKRRNATGNFELELTEADIQNYALAEIEKLFSDIGKSLRDFPDMPFPAEVYISSDTNRLIAEETSYNVREMKEKHDINCEKLNTEQKIVHDAVLKSVDMKEGGLFFVHGSGGCGKTFLWQTIISALRSKRQIVLPVASSGIAATLLPGGRTAHSRFHIPLKLDQYSSAGIKHGTEIAELLQSTDLIIWDEAPMQHRYAFECVDRSIRDIMAAVNPERAKKPFGGITVVFGGDFRQILPVIPKAGRPDIVGASLNNSRLWEHCKVFLLFRNMRLHAGNTDEQNRVIREFSDWQLKVGDGKVDPISFKENVSEVLFRLPAQHVLHSEDKPIQKLIDVVYPDFANNCSSSEYFSSRAILTPTNVVVDDINYAILDKLPGETYTYLSQDSLEDQGVEENDFDESFPIEYLNSLNLPCIPKHELKVKIGTPVMLMRNLNQINGLCNGTRMIVTGCKKNTIECEIMSGSHAGKKHLIPRIEMIPTETPWPFDFKRTQFPIQICFAMTINKSQGQSMDVVGLFLPRPVFCHGQLYVAISRVTSAAGLHILVINDEGKTSDVTSNVVFPEVFYNIPSVSSEY